MPASLVQSQFVALEPLRPGESGLVVDATQSPEAIVHAALTALATAAAGDRG
jgi:gluconokinase